MSILYCIQFVLQRFRPNDLACPGHLFLRCSGNLLHCVGSGDPSWSTAAQQDSTEDCEDDDAVSVVSMSSDNDDATTMTMPLVISHRNAESDWEFPSPGGRHSRMLQVRRSKTARSFISAVHFQHLYSHIVRRCSTV